MKKLLLILLLVATNSFAAKNTAVLNKAFNFAVATGLSLNQNLIDKVEGMTDKQIAEEIETYDKIKKDRLKRIK